MVIAVLLGHGVAGSGLDGDDRSPSPVLTAKVRRKSYQLYPMGKEAAAYLCVKRKRLTDSSHRDYERGLDKLARYFLDLEIQDFEPPIGTLQVSDPPGQAPRGSDVGERTRDPSPGLPDHLE